MPARSTARSISRPKAQWGMMSWSSRALACRAQPSSCGAIRCAGSFPAGFTSLPPFKWSGIPQETSVTRPARAAITWFARPTRSRYRRAWAFSGTMPMPTSLLTKMTVPRHGRRPRRASRRHVGRRRLRPQRRALCSGGVHQIVDPQRHAIDQHHAVLSCRGNTPGQIEGSSIVSQPRPRRAARCCSTRRAHLVVDHRASGHKDRRATAIRPASAHRRSSRCDSRRRPGSFQPSADASRQIVAAGKTQARPCRRKERARPRRA